MNRRSLLACSVAALALPLRVWGSSDPLRMRDLYKPDMSFSKLALSLAGERIHVQGFMAPPLKANAKFFVLTKRPAAICPYCGREADWSEDMLVVYAKRRLRVLPFNMRISVQGILEIGGQEDPETGFVSRARVRDATYGQY